MTLDKNAYFILIICRVGIHNRNALVKNDIFEVLFSAISINAGSTLNCCMVITRDKMLPYGTMVRYANEHLHLKNY